MPLYSLEAGVCLCVWEREREKNGLNRGRKDNKSCNPFIFTHQSSAPKLAHAFNHVNWEWGDQHQAAHGWDLVFIAHRVSNHLLCVHAVAMCCLSFWRDQLQSGLCGTAERAGSGSGEQRRRGVYGHGSPHHPQKVSLERLHSRAVGTGQSPLIWVRSLREKQ